MPPMASIPVPTSGAQIRFPGVDLLRGIAVVLVVMHHTGLRIPLGESPIFSGLPERFTETITGRGFEAVFIFFAVSGFLITSHSLSRWGEFSKIDAKAFYLRRAARILPCLLLVVALLAGLAAARLPHYVIERPDQSLGAAVLAALGFRINWYESITGYLPASWDVLWSLSVEEAFYLAFPLLCVTLGRTRLLVPALIVLALSLPWLRDSLRGQGLWYEKADGPGMAAIACGVLAALAVRRWPTVRVSTVRWLQCLGIVGLVVAGPFEDYLWRTVHNGFLLVVAASSAVLCAAAAWCPTANAPRRTDVLRTFGRLSYEIYLTHIFAMWIVVDAFDAAGHPPSAIVPAYAATLALSWALGRLLATVWSIPASRWVLSSVRHPGYLAPSNT